MENMWQRMLADESGLVISSELAMVGTLGVLGMVVGLESVSSAVNLELNDLSCAFRSLNQSYSYNSIAKRGHGRFTGSAFTDLSANGNNCGIFQADVSGQRNIGGLDTMLVQNSVPNVRGQILQERVIEEVELIEQPVTLRTQAVECPEDEIIEEHIIRRRVKADCAATLSTDCAKSSVLRRELKPEAILRSSPSTIEKIEIKPKKKN